MNDDNDGQVNCFQKGATEVLRQSLTKRPEPPSRSSWISSFGAGETRFCIYPKSASISSLAQVSVAVLSTTRAQRKMY